MPMADVCGQYARLFPDGGGRFQIAEKLKRVHAMSGIVRTGIHAARLWLIVTQIAGCSFAHNASLLCHLLSLGKRGDFLPHRTIHTELVQVDVSVRTIVSTEAAANAPILNDDLK